MTPEKTDGNAVMSAWRFEGWERMGGATVPEEDNVSGIFITCASLTDLGDENIFEPGPEDGPINKALGLQIDGHLLIGRSGQGDIGIDSFSSDDDQ
jgi:hypothetical protein